MNEMYKLVTPSQVVNCVGDVTPSSLHALGIKAIITDLDNTLVPWRGHEISQDVLEWIAELKRADIKIVIASNTMHPRRLHKLAGEMGIPYILGVRKPWPRGYRKSMEMLGSTPATTAMLGDQIFTDIMGANALKLHTILLRPALSTYEFIWTVMVRRVERILVRHLQATGRWPSPTSPNTPVAKSAA